MTTGCLTLETLKNFTAELGDLSAMSIEELELLENKLEFQLTFVQSQKNLRKQLQE